ncbi:MAG: HAD family hydrolase [Phycisphaerae bacterium]
MHNPDVILIDFYGTITSGDLDAVLRAAQIVIDQLSLPLTPNQFAQRWSEHFFRAMTASNQGDFKTLYECEVESLHQAVRHFAPVASLDDEPILAILDDYWRKPPIQPEVKAFFERVQRPVCCVSNADLEHLTAAIAHHDLPLDAVVCSESTRSYKPDPIIFQEALRVMGVRPERCCHLGDSLASDIAGARDVGIPAIWIKREKRIFDGSDERSADTIENLLQLPFLGIAPQASP